MTDQEIPISVRGPRAMSLLRTPLTSCMAGEYQAIRRHPRGQAGALSVLLGNFFACMALLSIYGLHRLYLVVRAIFDAVKQSCLPRGSPSSPGSIPL